MKLNIDVKEDSSFDVIVIGGGPSGCTAAAASARGGAKTLLIEGSGQLGGMGTSGLVPAWCPFTDGKQVIYRGLALKVFEEASKGNIYVKPGRYDWAPIDQERLKRTYDNLVLNAGAKILFHSSVCGVNKDGDSISSILVANKLGITAYKANVYIDCSGDGDVAAWAGAEVQKGDPKTGELMLSTLCFIMSNVDEGAFANGPGLFAGDKNSPIYPILKSGRFPLIKGIHLCANLVGPGTVGFNAGHIWDIDNTNPESVSGAMVEGRLLAEEISRALMEFHPKAFANSHLTVTANLLGARESRRVIGDYVMTPQDYWARRSFPDEIARNCYFMDSHTAVRDDAEREKANMNFAEEFKPEGLKPGESHGIPYRSLTPRGLKNLLVAGRSISCERPVQSSIRVMPVCLVTGEAAGAAAALASNNHGDVHTIDVDTLRKNLKAAGAYFE